MVAEPRGIVLPCSLGRAGTAEMAVDQLGVTERHVQAQAAAGVVGRQFVEACLLPAGVAGGV